MTVVCRQSHCEDTVRNYIYRKSLHPLASISTIKSDPWLVIEAQLLFEARLVLAHLHYSKLMAGNM